MARDGEEGEDGASVVVQDHYDYRQVAKHGERVEVVQESEVPDEERDGAPRAPRETGGGGLSFCKASTGDLR